MATRRMRGVRFAAGRRQNARVAQHPVSVFLRDDLQMHLPSPNITGLQTTLQIRRLEWTVLQSQHNPFFYWSAIYIVREITTFGAGYSLLLHADELFASLDLSSLHRRP